MIITHKGYVLRIKSSDISTSSRMTIGVKGINLTDDDFVIAAFPIRDLDDSLALFTADGYGKRIAPQDTILQNRAGRGVLCYKGNSYITCAAMVEESDQILLCGETNSICINASEIPVYGRMTQGNILLKSNRILSATKV